jgi:ATP-dependent helicase/nuclease subunit A
MGENANEGRAASAQALANACANFMRNEGFAWGDMALLFRSSTAYDVYENALEAADIPFVTVAGRGFYDRPEIRDLLNILAAIADPTDDLALVGALRSPAFAIPDAEIYRLRYPNNSTAPVKIFEGLKEQVNRYTSTQENNVTRISYLVTLHPYAIITELHSLSGRAPAAAILKRLLDLTHYRAILSADPNGARMIRNVEKLLADAHRSRLVSLTDFLAYVQTLRDVGLREGEAPADPSTGSGQAESNAGVIQLMTVHKAKGLEFPLTVLADATHQFHAHTAKVQLADTLLLDLRDDDFHSTAWQLAARLEDDRAQAEDARLLYVAATRAKEKLLISGHVKQKKDGTLSLSGWLAHFSFLENLSPEFPLLENGIYTEIYPYSQADDLSAPQVDSTSQAESPRESDLLDPLVPSLPLAEEKLRARESDPPQRVWRIVSKAKTPRAPAWLVGRLVHEAIHRWRFDDLDDFLKPFALESGLTNEAEIHAAIQESRRMLERLRAHQLFAELDSAREARHHEVRYDLPDGRGIIDLLYHTEAGWFIIDFKTDEVRSDAEAQSAISQNGYDRQVERYAQAVENQLNVKAKTRLVFLNVKDSIVIFDL